MTDDADGDESVAAALLEHVDTETVLVEHLQSNDNKGIGSRFGAAVGEVIGRELGKVLGERFIDPLLETENGATTEEPSSEDAAETDTEPDEDDVEHGDELADADEIFDAVEEILTNETEEDTENDDAETMSDIDTPDDLNELSYRDLQRVAKDVGVKANLARDEMTEELVDALDIGE